MALLTNERLLPLRSRRLFLPMRKGRQGLELYSAVPLAVGVCMGVGIHCWQYGCSVTVSQVYKSWGRCYR